MIPSIEAEDGVLHVKGAQRYYYATMETNGLRFLVTINYRWIGEAWAVRLWKMLP